MHLADVKRIVCRTKGLAILSCRLKICILATRGTSVVVVVTHGVEELSRITHLSKCLAEIINLVEIVVPIELVCAVAKAEGVDRNASLTILLNLGFELLKENDKKTVWVFVNKPDQTFDVVDVPCVVSDVLTF